ncbi:P-loop NTPase family protein [Commensalibacter papalotli (ex Servin-Garciduenas et al. 2014)]|uniref:Uncharacterized protein n=1 Tax=Commensalibacter papalotli (ex Servin-Garciduenas et al. 2014) TaxID=1208583 RepID=W7E356_9PROT|nr:hypothetical protein [Commensalibacter papalotli (ex Servin-Garciduenas et al. 2014)]EUK17501.1 hypothetical protein COMX_09889 [Commensalibacter papalotli (ex Servin-Garciduenas et al. 2014)]
MHHFSGTNWQQRPAEEFIALHNQAISGQVWVIEGNYSMCLPERRTWAMGFILFDVSTPLSLVRYLRRTLFENQRVGSLGNKKIIFNGQ